MHFYCLNTTLANKKPFPTICQEVVFINSETFDMIIDPVVYIISNKYICTEDN